MPTLVSYDVVIDGHSNLAQFPGAPAVGDWAHSIGGFAEVTAVRTDCLDNGSTHLFLTRLSERNLRRPQVTAATPVMKTQPQLSVGNPSLIQVILCDLEQGLAYGIVMQEQLSFRVGHQVKIKSGNYHQVSRICWVPCDTKQQAKVYVHLEPCAPAVLPRPLPSSQPYISSEQARELFGYDDSWAEARLPTPKVLQHTVGSPVLESPARACTPTNQPVSKSAPVFVTELMRKIQDRLDRNLSIQSTKYNRLFSMMDLEQLITLRTLIHSMFDVLDNISSPVASVVALQLSFYRMSPAAKIAYLLANGIYYNATSLSRGYGHAFKEVSNADIAKSRKRLSTMLSSLNLCLNLPKAAEPLPRPVPQPFPPQFSADFSDDDKENNIYQTVSRSGSMFRPISN